MNRSAEDGARSSPHYGDEGAWVPLRRTKVCAGDTVGKNVSDSGRPGIVRGQGMAGIVRHSQTKGRATGNVKPSLKPATVGVDISASEIPADAVPGVGSGRGTRERDQNKRFRIATIERRRWLVQKTNRRGKAPYCVAASGDEGLVST